MGRKDGLAIFVLASIFCLLLSRIVIAPVHHDQEQEILKRQTVHDCTTKLAGDLYGLGVRLGIYFQWFSGWVSNNFILDEINGGLDGKYT